MLETAGLSRSQGGEKMSLPALKVQAKLPNWETNNRLLHVFPDFDRSCVSVASIKRAEEQIA